MPTFEEFIKRVLNDLLEFALTAGGKLIIAILITVIGIFIIKTILRAFDRSINKSKLDPTAKGFIKSFINVLLYVFLIVCVVSILGVPAASIVSLVASAGVAIGLALQGSLANLAGGIMILIFKPFKLGDFIDCASGNGTGIDVGIFYTTLRTTDNRHTVIPNGTLSNIAITNNSVENLRRVDLIFNVAYGSDMTKVYSVLSDVIASCDATLEEPKPYIKISALSESSVDIALRVWCRRDKYFDVRSEVLEKVYNRFSEEGISIPFPQLSVHIEK